jgi:hypothetical protein
MTKKTPNLDTQMTSASPVTVKQADGTVEVRPPLNVDPNGKLVSITREVAHSVWKRDGKRCRYCGTMNGPFQLDPLRPGKATASNLVVACLRCITRKGDANWSPRVRSKYGGKRHHS